MPTNEQEFLDIADADVEPVIEPEPIPAPDSKTPAEAPGKPEKSSPQTKQKPRPSAKKPARKPHASGHDIPQAMKSALKRSPRKSSSGKPSINDDEAERKKALGGLTIQMIMQLAAPHTWAASLVPVLLAMALAVANEGTLSALMSVFLIFISVLMQSAVNTFNDYRDFVGGTDTKANQQDPSDAVLVYNDVEPNAVRNLALIFLGVAFALGIYVVVVAGWVPLVIALIGAACIFLYSAGPKPISRTPFGEFVSGITMGGLITLACYTALTSILDFQVLLLSLPVIIGIALIMLTNNLCDIEMDRMVGRRTLPVLLGRRDSVIVLRIAIIVWVVLIALLVAVFYPAGSLGLFFLLLAYPTIIAILRNPFVHKSRIAAMQSIVNLNAVFGLVYALSVLLSAVVVVIA